jgi:hypothetical protein
MSAVAFSVGVTSHAGWEWGAETAEKGARAGAFRAGARPEAEPV